MIFRHWTSGSIWQWPERWETKNMILVVAQLTTWREFLDQGSRNWTPGGAWQSPWAKEGELGAGRPGIHRWIPKEEYSTQERDRERAQENYSRSLLSLWLNSDQHMHEKSLGVTKGTILRTHIGTGIDCVPPKVEKCIIHGTSDGTFRGFYLDSGEKLVLKSVLIPPNRI